MKLEMKIHSLYICVKDMNRAVKFYESLFEQNASVVDDVMSIFEINNFRFCLFNNGIVNESVVWGDNCLPSFEVNNIDLALQKISELKCPIVFPLKKIGENMVMEFTDSEGNDIEIYCKA